MKFWVLSFGFWVLGFEFWDWNKVLGFGFWVLIHFWITVSWKDWIALMVSADASLRVTSCHYVSGFHGSGHVPENGGGLSGFRFIKNSSHGIHKMFFILRRSLPRYNRQVCASEALGDAGRFVRLFTFLPPEGRTRHIVSYPLLRPRERSFV